MADAPVKFGFTLEELADWLAESEPRDGLGKALGSVAVLRGQQAKLAEAEAERDRLRDAVMSVICNPSSVSLSDEAMGYLQAVRSPSPPGRYRLYRIDLDAATEFQKEIIAERDRLRTLCGEAADFIGPMPPTPEGVVLFARLRAAAQSEGTTSPVTDDPPNADKLAVLLGIELPRDIYGHLTEEGKRLVREKIAATETNLDRLRETGNALASWINNALDDPAVCDEMKATIRTFLEVLHQV